MSNILKIDFLYLDLSVCTRCQDTEDSLDDSLKSIVELLNNIGHSVQLNKVFIETKEQAIHHQFISSPTIRLEGQDIQMDVKESHCSTCSSLTSDASVDCRMWLYKGEEFSSPPQAMIIDAVLSKIYNPTKNIKPNEKKQYQLPANLEEYFSKKDKLCANVNKTPEESSSCCDSNSCC